MNHPAYDRHWDVIVLGGGITGAGVFREAVKSGLKTLLLEQNDFAWGTSSRTSKLVHGGLRYLKEGKVFLTMESVRERERLMKEAKGLVAPLPFYMPVYGDKGPGRITLEAGLTLYDLFALKKRHHYLSAPAFMDLEKDLDGTSLQGGFEFMDAQIDDARLVLRVIDEALNQGGRALNYTRVTAVERDHSGYVHGVSALDTETGESLMFHAKAVINATGTWAETLHPSPQKGLHLRPLRGSHLFFSKEALPVNHALALMHPADNRPIFVIPWEGAVLVGTTDLDHHQDLAEEPAITKEEASYLMDGVKALFPHVQLSLTDLLSTMTGVRPVLSRGHGDPSKESREHVVWVDKGLITITGGKLTTFRKLAWDALKAVRPFVSGVSLAASRQRVFSSVPAEFPESRTLDKTALKRLYGRYGMKAFDIIRNADADDLTPIPGTPTLWAEFRYAAQHESVRHLQDLLLRRVRVGIVTPEGGLPFMDRIRQVTAPVLNWTDDDWEREIHDYARLYRSAYALPEGW